MFLYLQNPHGAGQVIDYFQCTLWYQKDLSGGTVSPPLLEKVMWQFQVEHLLGQGRNSILKTNLKFK